MLDRFLKSPRYRESQINIGWDEEHCARYDAIASEDHSFLATAAQRFRRENARVLVLKGSGPNGPMNQRDTFWMAQPTRRAESSRPSLWMAQPTRHAKSSRPWLRTHAEHLRLSEGRAWSHRKAQRSNPKLTLAIYDMSVAEVTREFLGVTCRA